MSRARGQPPRSLLLAAVFSAFLGLPPDARPAVDASTVDSVATYEDAVESFQAGEIRIAVIHLKNALQADPNHLPARLLLGRSYLVLGNPESAEKELRRALELGADPSLVIEPLGESLLLLGRYDDALDRLRTGVWSDRVEAGVQTLRGRVYLALRDLKEAEMAFEIAVGQAPDFAPARIGLARVRMARGRWDEADDLLTDAMDRAPGYAEGWFVRGQMARARGDLRAAMMFYGRAIAQQPNHLPARTYRAATAIEMDDPARAEDDLAVVRDLDPIDPHLAYWWARMLDARGDAEAAKLAYEEAVNTIRAFEDDAFDRDPDTLLVIGLTFAAIGDNEVARTYLGEVVRTDPYNPHARKALGRQLNAAGRHAESIDVLRPIMDLRPRDIELIGSLATALLRERKYTEGTELLRRAVEMAPDNQGLRARLGLSHIGRGDRETGLALLRETIGVETDDIRPEMVLAQIHLRAREYADAGSVLESALGKSPDDPEIHHMIAAARIGLDDLAAARAHLERTLELNPDHRAARLNLARLDATEDRFDTAEAGLRELLGRDPADLAVMLALADLARQRDDPDSEIGWLRRASDVDAERLATKLRLIDALLRHGDTDQALALARATRANHAATLGLLEALGRAERAAGNRERAANAFTGMRDFAKDSPGAMLRVSRRQIEVEDNDGALRTLRSAVANFPQNTAVLRALINLETRTGRADRASERIERMLEADPESVFGWTMLGESKQRSGDLEGAVKAYETALRKRRNPAVLVRLYLVADRLGRGESVVGRLGEWLAENPRDRTVRRTLVGAHIKAGRLDAAIRDTRMMLDETPDDPELLNNLAWLYSETENPQALATAERAHALAPTNPSVLDTLGWILVRQGAHERGLALLRDARARAGDKLDIRYHMAVALAKLGRYPEARRELRRVADDGAGTSLGRRAEDYLKEIEEP